MKYAHIDEKNKLLGWYDSEIHEIIPTPNIKVTEEQWKNSINNNHNKINNDGTSEHVDFRSDQEKIINENLEKIERAKKYLKETDFYFTVDKYTTLSEDKKVELGKKREEARTIINELESKL